MSELAAAEESCLQPLQELNLQEALELAIFLQQQNRLAEAEALFCRILDTVPDHADALHYYGMVKYFQGDKDKGIGLIEQALSIAPEYIQAYNNLGNMYLQQKQFEKAEAAYRKVLAINPNFKSAYNNLGVALKECGRIVEAVDVLLKAIQLDPYLKLHYQNLSNVFRQNNELENAIDVYLEALAQRPFNAETYRNLSASLKTCELDERAVQVLRTLLDLDPDNSLALHTLSAYTGENRPARAADGYVRETFDRFADSFDLVLKNLGYKAPFLVEKAFREVLGSDPCLAVLDAGCGTGLCGPLLRPSVGRLIGVDLSGRMLARAKERLVYDELIEAELTNFLNRSEASFDAIVSADVLCYFGDLSPALCASARALKPGGHLIFTVEALDAEQRVGYQLNVHGRYSHGQNYVEQSLAGAGLILINLESVILRLESAVPVGGFLVTAQRAEQCWAG
jgi:predicted TPR repeat methyltransferase